MAFQAKKISWVTIVAGMGAAMASMFLGSAFGTSGTLIGAAAGSLVLGVGGIVLENAIQGARYAAREMTLPLPSSPPAVRRVAKISALGLGMAALFAGVAFGTLLTIEAATGKTLYSNLTGQHQYGNSFSYSTKPPPSSQPVVTPSSSTSSSSLSPSPSLPQTPETPETPSPTPSESTS